MGQDAALLQNLAQSAEPILHLYDWQKPSLTYGYFLAPEKFLCTRALERYDIEAARRPTGGGVTLHLGDLAFSLLVPKDHPFYSANTLDCYYAVNTKVKEAFTSFFGSQFAFSFVRKETEEGGVARHFCMANPTKYDVVVGNQKIGGAAQRKTRFGFLHQGTISLGLLEKTFLEELLLQKEVAGLMLTRSFAPLGESWSPKELQEARKGMQEALKHVFCHG